jgi:hypothetical protein
MCNEEFTNVLRKKNTFGSLCYDTIEFNYRGYLVSVKLSDIAISPYSLERITATFELDDWWDSEYQRDRQVKRYISVKNTKLDITKLLTSLDYKIAAHKEFLHREEIQSKAQEESKQRVQQSIKALREVFPDIRHLYGNEVKCKGIYLEVDDNVDCTYRLKGQTKGYSLDNIIYIVDTLETM